MTNLSPATQTVLDAFLNGYICKPGHNVAFESDRNGLAAALRAAADQVVPEDFDYWDGRTGEYGAGCETGQNERNAYIRQALLAIAAELEGTNG
jgi:hypothetical protein